MEMILLRYLGAILPASITLCIRARFLRFPSPSAAVRRSHENVVGALACRNNGKPARRPPISRPPYYTAPAPLCAYSWTGPYLGGNLGYEWGNVSNNPTRPSGFEGGIEGGYNWQTGQFVFGGEADLQLSGASDTFAPWKFSNPWFGTLRGRAGVAISNVLMFGTAGVAYGSLSADSPGTCRRPDQCRVDRRRRRRSRLRAELVGQSRIAVLDLSDRSFALTGTSNGLPANLMRLGVNYHF